MLARHIVENLMKNLDLQYHPDRRSNRKYYFLQHRIQPMIRNITLGIISQLRNYSQDGNTEEMLIVTIH
jgi:hypothetical protein